MSSLEHTAACLRIWGEELIPDELTHALGAQPSFSHLKGDTIVVNARTGAGRIAKTGAWQLTLEKRTPGDLDEQIDELFARLNHAPALWASLQSRFELDLYCGLFMDTSNDSAAISPRNMRLLGERGIELRLEIYDPTREAAGIGRFRRGRLQWRR
ncbi:MULTISPECIES: DUF4279 domain-containing protein [unclassified Lysobacter]|uniref:DUF4279 domain-containing protein n=1 Tax=unclassified Lysobacter TaxID=2635362 RepID=UPI001BE8782F|nr:MULTISPECIES: DUF4279 domain-containing protein [unclassified Lysobacter]MBT2748233.1 DUF4279 domain-containing protein [Lysobacter sp. ISL-42]MBT2753299.1 DUF4279 domain-containing protein [Lysobacter sp. ISL-50]MBT2779024.1 DUF4279 domain-containing protein [Lysobacter sp. ISL-54]MBT2784184.1 DUF4279 domain-containing protein [Lysobacter sp. ISL-52]